MTPDDNLLKLATYNKAVRETFDIIETPTEHVEDQYFVMYGMEEGADYAPENIRGVWGAADVAYMMSQFRQDGTLRIPEPAYMTNYRRGQERRYEIIQPKWVYFLKAESVMYKVPTQHYEQTMEVPDGV